MNKNGTQTSERKYQEYISKHYPSVEIDNLVSLFEFTKEMNIEHPQSKRAINRHREIKKAIKKRKSFLKKTIAKWQEQTRKIFRDTNIKWQLFRGGTWRLLSINEDPDEVSSKIFNEEEIQAILFKHDAIERRIKCIEITSSVDWLVLNLARLFPHTETTVVNKTLHVGHVNWRAVLYVFKFFQSSGFLPQDVFCYLGRIDQNTFGALSKRHKEAIRKAAEKGFEEDFILDPQVKEILKNREELNKAHDKAYNCLKKSMKE